MTDRPNSAADTLSPASDTRVLIVFLALSFGWTWAFWAVAKVAEGRSAGLVTALYLASAFGPSLAAIVTVLACEGRSGFGRWLKRCLQWRLGWRWYALALLGPGLVILAALGLHVALGGSLLPSPAEGKYLRALWLVVPTTLLGGPLGEEFGWRGFALPAVAARIDWRRASIGIGVIWGLWHLPLFYMEGMAQSGLPMGLFLASSVALSVVMARLCAGANYSVLPAIALHAAVNWGSMVLPVMPEGGSIRPYAFAVTLLILIALFALVRPGPAPRP
jgi:membrane protease YdiL (CAAX protease family)